MADERIWKSEKPVWNLLDDENSLQQEKNYVQKLVLIINCDPRKMP